jgi:LAO/AO transport system kinase
MPDATSGETALAERIARADKTAVAAALNLIEDKRPEAQARIVALLASLPLRAGVHRVGITGPPGVGKSTLTSLLAAQLRARGRTVGVLAVDPTSLRSGGALLGDRARMDFDPSDQGLFVRSLATAGALGGLTHAASSVIAVLSAAYDRVLVETVGVGQSETEVEHAVDSVCLVVQPGSGDVLQFIKAGVMEIPDLLVVNKGDQALAQQAATDLAVALSALRRVGVEGPSGDRRAWKPPVLVTSALDGSGVTQLADALDAHLGSLAGEGLRARRLSGAVRWALSMLLRRHGEHALETLGGGDAVRAAISARLAAGAPPPAVALELASEHLRRLAAPG